MWPHCKATATTRCVSSGAFKWLTTVLLLVDVTAGIAAEARSHVSELTSHAKSKAHTDRKEVMAVHASRSCPSMSIAVSQTLSKAAVMHDAKAIRRQMIICLKERVWSTWQRRRKQPALRGRRDVSCQRHLGMNWGPPVLSRPNY
mmetsp:Transcript_19107/g.38966  ORF Transcript_19107/g.38966 Transcript_19107/m.38966 type:complete len:145 (-) Transcript_19107:222-656(-)